MTEPRTVAVLSAVLSNGGDAAILRGLERALRAASDAELRFVVFDAAPETTAPRFPDLAVRPALAARVWPAAGGGLARATRRTLYLPRARRLLVDARAARRIARLPLGNRLPEDPLAVLARADAIVSTGGTYLTDTYWLGPRLAALDAVRALGRPFALYTQSVGPFRRAETRRRLAAVFADARLTVLRDERSAGEVRALAPGARLAVRADAAFGLAEPEVLAAAPGRRMPEAPHVVVSVREWPHFARETAAAGMARYAEAVGAAATHAVRVWGGRVTFLSTCQGTPGYRYDDAAVARRIADALPADVRDGVAVREASLSPQALVAAFGQADLVVATRMHAAILALCAGTPVIPIAYERKTADLFQGLGRPDWVADIDAVTPASLVARLDRVRAALPEARPSLFAHVEAARTDALAAGRDVVAALGLRGAP